MSLFKKLVLSVITLAMISPALADMRYDQICVSSDQDTNVFFVYDNLNLLRENQLTASPVKDITVFTQKNKDLPQQLNKNFNDLENQMNLSKVYYSNKSEVNSEDGRIILTLNGSVVLSIPFMNPDQNPEGRFATTTILEDGMIFNGQKINQVTYSDCGQLAD